MDTNTTTNLTDFEAERPRLRAIATRILGSSADADDVVQEAWLRLSTTAGVEDLPAWLTTVTTRLCLDHLRKRGTRADVEAKVSAEAAAGAESQAGPEADMLIAERVGGAMQVVLDALAPAERAAFVLHDVFGYPFEDISVVLGRSGAAVRQLASRARRKVQGIPEPEVEIAARAESRAVVEAFLAASHGGELPSLLALLAPDAIMRADALGQGLGAESEYAGAAAIAARFDGARGAAPVTVDGERAGAWITGGGNVKVVFCFQVRDGLVREIELIADPDVIAMMDVVADPEEHAS
ncbi:MAG TPA: sigma-70 family RNA polymerase sigma factor [Baekduia sp.]|uniref:sigma-70 family RNA polymerase sigma factor n=1 Tax=Baekduia sp. TaxID=2600305 RepID=UPI002D770716|nr:sigma-70 family RNA polymerase sigma factor [Baekduia sp.]HET6509996.1 sigma-70 family RNA polymerase sigma factor [Baekduia sp.]